MAFHAMQCRMLIYALQVTMAMATARFIFAQMNLLAGNTPPAASLDVALVLVHFVALFLTTCPTLVTPRSLDLWYIVLQGLFILPFLTVGPRDVVTLSNWTFVLRVLLGLSVKRGWLALTGNAACSILVMRIIGFQMESALFSGEITKLSFLLLCVFSIRQLVYRDARSGLDLKTRTIELEAVSSLLRGFCDAVVEVDDNLQLVTGSKQLSTMLLRENGNSDTSLAGTAFVDLFCEEDRERLHEGLLSQNSSAHTLALNARILDSDGSHVKVELLHVQFCSANNRSHRLVGMREFQDMQDMTSQRLPSLSQSSIPGGVGEASFEVFPVSRSGSNGSSTGEGRREHAKKRPWLLFDVSTFQILVVSDEFKALCRRCAGQHVKLKNKTFLDLTTDLTYDSLTERIQDLVNSHSSTSTSDLPPLDLGVLTLLGTLQVRSTLYLEHDSLLDGLVATLKISPAGAVQLTKANVDLLENFHRRTRRSRRSRSSRSKSSGGSSGTSVGSILDLHKTTTAL